MIYVAAGVPRLVIGTALIVWRPTEFAALLGVAIARVRPGAGRLARPAAPARARRALRASTAARALGARPSTTPTPCSRSSPSPTSTSWSPATCSTSTRRPVRRRADPGQGGAVPAPVRGGARLPVDVDGRVAPAQPCCKSLSRSWLIGVVVAARRPRCSPGWRWSSSAATSTPPSRTSCGSSPCSAPCSSMLQLSSTACSPGRPAASVLPGLGRPARRRRCSARWPSTVDGLLTIVLARGHVAAASCSLVLQPAANQRCGGRRRHPARRAGQWAAACQLLPVPTETSRGTVSSAAEAICSRTSASSASCSPSATSKTSSSWTWSSIREARLLPRAARGRR